MVDERGESDAISNRMESVSTLASGVAHQINNPLAFIAANLEMISEELAAKAPELTDVAAMIEEAKVGVERIKTIVKGLMTFSRSDEGRRVPLDVERILELAIDMTSDLRSHARVIRDFAQLPPVEANEARLCQVFINVLQNAVESFGDHERNDITITTRTNDAGDATIEIVDTGCGIAPEIRERIFDPFFTTKVVGEGVGLGLSVCHNIVRQLGGDITFETEVDAGSSFRIVLPAASRLPAAQTPQLTASRRGRVLVIDDEVIFANALRRLLSRDHTVSVVNDARAALDLVNAGESFDVILCDLMMPGLTGMALHQEISEREPELARRMIFLTGGAFTLESQAFLERMPDQWLEKPCDLEELRAKVKQVIG
jgi:CheY-like chemotaxis protein